MAGPPAAVKIAAPIPTHLFAPVPNLGPALDNLRNLPAVYQHRTGYPTILPASWHPWQLLGGGGPNPPILPLRWDPNDLIPTPPVGWWQQLVDRFRPQRTY